VLTKAIQGFFKALVHKAKAKAMAFKAKTKAKAAASKAKAKAGNLWPQAKAKANDILSERKYSQLFTHESNIFLLKQLSGK